MDKPLTKNEIINLVASDAWMMRVLEVAQTANLPDWMIGAGFIRNKVWGVLHGFENVKVTTQDLDLIYFDPHNISKDFEQETERMLKELFAFDWSVKNMARMHEKNNDPPYSSTEDGLAHWVETATCIAVKLSPHNEVQLIAPHGIDDLVNLVLRPAPHMKHRLQDFYDRVEKKGWLKKWPKLKVVVE